MRQLTFDALILQDQPPPEQWKPFPISGLETLYEISDLGRIRTLVRRKTMRAGQFLKLKPRKSGYCDANIKGVDGRRTHYPVHRMVMLAFLPIDNPDKFEVNHIDGLPSNNSLGNLEWCSHHINMIHYARVLKPARDKKKIDTRTNLEKLTKTEIAFIHSLLEENVLGVDVIARMFCISEIDVMRMAQAA